MSEPQVDDSIPEQNQSDINVAKLASEHWSYVASVLIAHGESNDVVVKCGHHYISAFIHGWKHAKEATQT